MVRQSGWSTARVGVLCAALASSLTVAHEVELVGGPVAGSGYNGTPLLPADGKILDFPAENVALLSWLTSEDLSGELQTANDIWGYISPAGREYAIIGLLHGTAFVEVTDPIDPVVVGVVPGPESIWRDIAVYRDYAYIVSEGGGGVQVVDLGKIDRGTVRRRRPVVTDGLATAHNISVNQESGYAYLSGSNLANGGLVALDLANPRRPRLEAGSWPFFYVHDALVVSYQRGANAGREIAFAFAAESGVQIIDVTDKRNMFTITTVEYPGLAYCHSGWVSKKNRFLLVNDEADELHEVEHEGQATTRTHILDIRELERAKHVRSVTNGVSSIDHNTMVQGDRLYAANYQSGFRVSDARKVKRLREIAYFDTYPEADDIAFAGAWGVFADFPSGIVVVSDINRGLFVLMPPA
jgi:choice-of-anchor B domain-containing protein